MSRFAIAVRLEALGLPIRQAIEAAGRLGAKGVQFDAVGELAPAALSQTGRRHLKHVLASQDLTLVGIGFPTRRGYDVADRLEGRITATLGALRFASELGAPVVVNHIGQVPAQHDDPTTRHFFDAMTTIGREADRVGARFAIKTGWDSPQTLADLLTGMAPHGLVVCYDPAMVMVRGHDAYGGVPPLHDWIALVQVRDAVRSGTTVSGYLEVPLGDGDVDWSRFLATLAEVDYHGFLVVDRESGNNRLQEMTQAVDYLTQL